MRGADTLIPARFLTLLGHICVLITLLWENEKSVSLCLPSPYHHSYLSLYKKRLGLGFSAGLILAVLELVTFISGLTMFAPFVTLLSILSHGLASVVLTYFVVDGWLCNWYWPIFAFTSVLPSIFDIAAAVLMIKTF